jgi:CHAT domain-containing protein
MFMQRFYTYLRAGDSKDRALQRAQLDFLHSPVTAAPIYWAAFSMNGDWR